MVKAKKETRNAAVAMSWMITTRTGLKDNAGNIASDPVRCVQFLILLSVPIFYNINT